MVKKTRVKRKKGKNKFVYCSVGPTHYGRQWGEAQLKAEKYPNIRVVAIDKKFPKGRPPLPNIIKKSADVEHELQYYGKIPKADKVVINYLADNPPRLSNKFLKSVPKKNSRIVIRTPLAVYAKGARLFASKIPQLLETLMRRLNKHGFEIEKYQERAMDRSAPNRDTPYIKLVVVRGNPRKLGKTKNLLQKVLKKLFP